MKTWIKAFPALALAVVLLCMASAQAVWTEPYGDSFAALFQLKSIREQISVSTALIGTRLYSLTGKGTVFSFDAQTREYEEFSRVPAFPSVDLEIPLARQSAADRKAMEDGVSQLVAGTDGSGLYGINRMTGAVGLIDREGIHYQEVRLDTSPFFAPGSDYPEYPLYLPEIRNGILDGYIIRDPDGSPCLTWLSFSLEDGTCVTAELPGAFGLCRWKEDQLLAAVRKGSDAYELAVCDRQGTRLGALETDLAAVIEDKSASLADLTETEGRMAWSEADQTLYYMNAQSLWKSTDDAGFEQIDRSATPFLSGQSLLTSPDGKLLVFYLYLRK